MAQGVLDVAFTAIEGDDTEYCTTFRRANREEAKQLQLLTRSEEPWENLGMLAIKLAQIASLPDERLEDVRAKEQNYAELVRSTGYEFGRQLADAWCAAFVWIKRPPAKNTGRPQGPPSPPAEGEEGRSGGQTLNSQPSTQPDGFDYPITNEVLRRLERNTHDASKWMREEIRRLADQYQFFHWYLAFPDVFQVPPAGQKPDNELCGWNGGFDVILGNPPWERVKLQEKEWFVAHGREDIANAPNAADRRRLIQALKKQDLTLYRKFVEDVRRAEGGSHLLRNSGLYPLTARGDINLYAVFAEVMRKHLSPNGRVG